MDLEAEPLTGIINAVTVYNQDTEAIIIHGRYAHWAAQPLMA